MKTSLLEIVNIHTGARRVAHRFDGVIEAPNWTLDGRLLIFNRAGKLFGWDLAGEIERRIETGRLEHLNNDHVLSPDGNAIAFSHHSVDDGVARIYRVSLSGGEPMLVTREGPSYLHGWSPDGKHLAYCAKRNGQFDIYVIDVDGRGPEVQLTFTPELDDGPEFCPSGEHIWFNSAMKGPMQIWRMARDGSEAVPMTDDPNTHDWFPHVSPDGVWVVYLSYLRDQVEASDHPPGQSVAVRLMPASGGPSKTLVELYGGQGTINVNSWSPDSQDLAFVSYEP